MQEVFLGEIIRKRRLELHMTQEQLCEGICEQATISRFENGAQTPSRNRIKAILQRLGLPDERFYGLVSRNEEHIKNLQDEIHMDGVRFERANDEERARIRVRVMDKLAELERIIEPDDELTRQFILREKAHVDTSLSLEDRLKLQMDAMRLTVPRFDLDEIDRFRYSHEELTLISKIGVSYSRMGQKDRAAEINAKLLRYIDDHFKSMRDYGGSFCMVSCSLSIELCGSNRYDEAAVVAERGWRVCIEYGHYQYLPSLIAVLAECQYKLGNTEKSAELYLQAYYLYKAINDDHNREIIRKEMKERLNLEPPYCQPSPGSSGNSSEAVIVTTSGSFCNSVSPASCEESGTTISALSSGISPT